MSVNLHAREIGKSKNCLLFLHFSYEMLLHIEKNNETLFPI
jgi:hypothetical protein